MFSLEFVKNLSLMKNSLRKGIDFTGISVVYFCHDGKGRFVMQKRGAGARDEQGSWDIGAGGLEWGDGPEATLQKEIKEEYGTEVISFEFLGYRHVARVQNGQESYWLALDYKVLVSAEDVQNNEPHKFDEVAWFTRESIPTTVHSQLPFFLEKYQKMLFN